METNTTIERGILVCCNWLVFGLIGIGFTLEGGAREAFLVSLVGIAGFAGGFISHIIINKVFQTSFTTGEIALALGLFAVGSSAFIVAWAIGQVSPKAFLNGLALLAVLVVGFFAYVITRYGLGGAFRKFDVVSSSSVGARK